MAAVGRDRPTWHPEGENVTKSLQFPGDIRPDFSGFSKEAFTFLSDLKRNNQRAWFKARKEVYDREVKFATECLLGEFRDSVPVRGDPAHGMFRIYRDVRFAADKSPYKTHVGAVLTRSGAKGDPGLVYIHIEPGGSFVAAGFYAPTKDFLHAWRRRMSGDPAEFLEVAADLERAGHRLEHRGAIKTMPHGFRAHATGPVAEHLRWKHFLVSRPVTDRRAQGRQLLTIIRDLMKVAMPLLEYGWSVLEEMPGDDPRRHMRTAG